MNPPLAEEPTAPAETRPPSPDDGPAGGQATASVVRPGVQAKAARHGALGLVGAVAAGGGGLALTVIVGRLMSAHDAGIYFTAVAMFTIASGILLLGTDTGLVRTLAALRAAGSTNLLRPIVLLAVRPVVIASTIAAVLTFVGAPWLTKLAFSSATAPQMSVVLRLLAPFLVASTLSMALLNGAARGLGSLRSFTTLQQIFLPASRALLVLVVGVAAGAGLSSVNVAYAAVVAWALPLLIAMVLAVRAVGALLPSPAPHGPVDMRTFWRTTIPRGIAATFEVIIVWADVVLVTILLGPAWGGIYAAASRFVTSGTFALQAVRLSVGPLLAGAFARTDRAEAEGVYRLSVQWAILSTWPVYVAMAIFAPGVLSILGPEYASAAIALTILSVAMLGVVATGNANTVLNMAHHSHWAAMNTGLAVLVMMGLDLALIPRFGIVGAAIGWSAAMLTDALCGVSEIRFGLGLKSFDTVALRAMATVLLAFAAPAMAVRLLTADRPIAPLWVLIIGCLVSGSCYLAALGAQRRPLGLDLLVSSLKRKKASNARIPVQSGPVDADASPNGDDEHRPTTGRASDHSTPQPEGRDEHFGEDPQGVDSRTS